MKPTPHEKKGDVILCDETAYQSFSFQGGSPVALPILPRKSQVMKPGGMAANIGQLFLGVSGGPMIVFIHGWHKLEGWIAYHQHVTPWELVEEVVGKEFPAPLASAVTATLAQCICSMFIVAGLYARITAALLDVAPGGAILQNLLSDHDPKLALLYTLVAITLVSMGGGRFSLDAFVLSKSERRSTWEPKK